MIRLRLLFLALLPGLLLSSGASLRICLHRLLDLGAGCVACSDAVQSCCGGSEEREGPAVRSPDDCPSCCIQLEAAQQRIAPGPRADDLAALPLALALPSALPCALAPVPSPRFEPIRTRADSRAPPAARGILPLRI